MSRLGRAGVVLAAVALLCVPCVSAAAPPVFNKRTGLQEVPLSVLESAVARGDRAEIARWAERVGAARMAATLAHSREQKTLLSVLEAVLHLPGNLRLIDRIALLVEATRDTEVAERAAQVLGAVFSMQSPAEVDTWDVPPDAVSAACLALTRVSADAALAVTLRLAALESLAEASSFCAPAASLAQLFSDPSAELRRAAFLVAATRPPGFAVEMSGHVNDAVPWVAATAGAVWCARRRFTPGGHAQPLPASLRKLVTADGVWIEDALDLLPCLYRSAEPADRRVFEDIRKGPSGPLRDRAHEIVEQDRARPSGG